MNFVGIIFALLAERAIGHVPGWGEHALLSGAVNRLRRWINFPGLWNSWAAPLLIVVPPVALVYFLRTELVHPISELVFSFGILLLCLGPRDLADDVHRWLQARAANDGAGAERLWRGLMRGPEPDPSHRTVLGALFIQSHERLFGVLLWFFVCGPAGALAYRLASRLPRVLHEGAADDQPAHWNQAMRVAEQLHGLLAWIPARVTAALFGLAGSLDDAIAAWRKLATEPHEWRSHTWAILAEVSASSLSMETPDGEAIAPESLQSSVNEVLNMQLRALVILLAMFALFTTGTIL